MGRRFVRANGCGKSCGHCPDSAGGHLHCKGDRRACQIDGEQPVDAGIIARGEHRHGGKLCRTNRENQRDIALGRDGDARRWYRRLGRSAFPRPGPGYPFASARHHRIKRQRHKCARQGTAERGICRAQCGLFRDRHAFGIRPYDL